MTAATNTPAAPTRAVSPRSASDGAPRSGIGCAAADVVALGVSLAGAADPSLKDQIDAARSDAGQLSDRVDAQTAQIASLTEQAHQAGAQAMVLNAQVADGGGPLARARHAARRRRAQARPAARGVRAPRSRQLDQRLVAIYESDTPDYITVLLSSDGYDDLSTRSDYLQALHNADKRVADRVALAARPGRRPRPRGRRPEAAGRRARPSSSAPPGPASWRASRPPTRPPRPWRDARASRPRRPSPRPRARSPQLEQQLAEQQAAAGRSQQGSAAPAYLGGPYSIPTYIVMCESGGNYHALNASSGAGGAYQILPSTWRAYGGEGAPQDGPRPSRTGSPARSGATPARAPGPAPSA